MKALAHVIRATSRSKKASSGLQNNALPSEFGFGQSSTEGDRPHSKNDHLTSLRQSKAFHDPGWALAYILLDEKASLHAVEHIVWKPDINGLYRSKSWANWNHAMLEGSERPKW